MKTKIILAFALLAALSASAAWKQTAAGTYVYDDPANWDDAGVDGVFNVGLAGNQTIVFTNDYELTTGLFITYGNERTLTFKSGAKDADGVARDVTVKLRGGMTISPTKNSYKTVVSFGSETVGEGVAFDLCGETCTIKTGKAYPVINFVNAFSNGGLVLENKGPMNLLSSENSCSLGTVFGGSGTVTISGATFDGPVSFEAGTVSFTENCTIPGAASFIAPVTLAVASGKTISFENSEVPEGSSFANLLKSGDGILQTAQGLVLAENQPMELSIAAGTWNFGGIVSGTGTLRKVGAGKLNLAAQNTFAGRFEFEEGTIVLAEGMFDMANVTVYIGENGVLKANPDAGYSVAEMLASESAFIDKRSSGVLAFASGEKADFDLSDHPFLRLGASGGDHAISGNVTWPATGTIRVGGGDRTLTLTADNVFSGKRDLDVRGIVQITTPSDLSGEVTIHSGATLALAKTATMTNAKLIRINRGTLSVKNDASGDLLKANIVLLNLGKLYFEAAKNKYVTNRIAKVILSGVDDFSPSIGGTAQISWGASGHNTFWIGELFRTTPCLMNLNKDDGGLGDTRRIIIAKGAENVGAGVAGTATCPVVPFIRRDGAFAYNDPETGLRLLNDAEYAMYTETVAPESLPAGENVWLSAGKTLTIPEGGASVNAIRTAYGAKQIINGGSIDLLTGAICLDGNDRPYLQAAMDAGSNRIYVMERSGKGQSITCPLHGSDGLTVGSWSESSNVSSGGTGVTIDGDASRSTYTGDTYIFSRVDACNDFLPRGKDRPGDLYLYGYWMTGNYDIQMNGLNGTGWMNLGNSFTITTTVGVDGSDGNFEGTVNRSNGNWHWVKEGYGTQRFGGKCSHNGTTTVNAGMLQFDGEVTQSAVTVKAGAALGGVGSIMKAVMLEAGATLYPGSTNVLDDTTLDLAGDLQLGGALKIKVYDKKTVSSVDVAGTVTAAGSEVMVELDGDRFSGEACILESGTAALPDVFKRGANCGYLFLRNDGKELWLVGRKGLKVIVR